MAPRQVQLTVGPFGGIVDATDPNQARPTLLFDAVNVSIPDPLRGSAVLARHGFQGQTTQLGDTTNRTGQGIFLHRRLDGTLDRFTFGGGKMYRWDGATTFTDITPAGINLHESNPVYCATFNDEVLVSDEFNKPWIYTPGTGAAETIQYNAADDEWATRGGPVIYSGYPVFILKGSGQATLTTELGDTLLTEDGLDLITELTSGLQNSITWGNALDPRTGYSQTDFDHVWQLTQTSSEILSALSAQEGALLYFRTNGIGYITGAIADDWASTATRDGLSQTKGAASPAAVVAVDTWVYFLDLDGRVHRCAAGGGEPVELWYPMRRTVEANVGTSATRDNVALYARGAYHPTLDLVLFTIWDRQTLYAFHARTGAYVGQWRIGGDGTQAIHVTAMGATVDRSNRSVFCVLGTRGATYQTSDLGVFWRQQFPDDPKQWLDQPDASVASYTAFERACETHWLNHDAAQSFRATDAVASVVGSSSRHAVRLQYAVPSSGLSSAIVAQSSAVTGEMSGTDSIATARWGFGRNAQGGAMRLRISATHSDNVQFGLHDCTVSAVVTKARPKAA